MSADGEDGGSDNVSSHAHGPPRRKRHRASDEDEDSDEDDEDHDHKDIDYDSHQERTLSHHHRAGPIPKLEDSLASSGYAPDRTISHDQHSLNGSASAPGQLHYLMAAASSGAHTGSHDLNKPSLPKYAREDNTQSPGLASHDQRFAETQLPNPHQSSYIQQGQPPVYAAHNTYAPYGHQNMTAFNPNQSFNGMGGMPVYPSPAIAAMAAAAAATAYGYSMQGQYPPPNEYGPATQMPQQTSQQQHYMPNYGPPESMSPYLPEGKYANGSSSPGLAYNTQAADRNIVHGQDAYGPRRQDSTNSNATSASMHSDYSDLQSRGTYASDTTRKPPLRVYTDRRAGKSSGTQEDDGPTTATIANTAGGSGFTGDNNRIPPAIIRQSASGHESDLQHSTSMQRDEDGGGTLSALIASPSALFPDIYRKMSANFTSISPNTQEPEVQMASPDQMGDEEPTGMFQWPRLAKQDTQTENTHNTLAGSGAT